MKNTYPAIATANVNRVANNVKVANIGSMEESENNAFAILLW
jgi:hypothetical protein